LFSQSSFSPPSPTSSWGRIWIRTAARKVVASAAHFLAGLIALIALPRLRQFCWNELRIPLHGHGRRETAIVAAAHLLLPFAIVGGVVLWYWVWAARWDLPAVSGNSKHPPWPGRRLVDRWDCPLLLSVLPGPIIEELVFRGMLFRTWEARWGWLPSLLATSLVFAHTIQPRGAFVGSVIYICIYRANVIASRLHRGPRAF
jgi:membrane protease YdiL (CAAX protease family)